MELLGLNKNFEPIGYIEFINLQWIRRYYECGEFSMQIRAQDYDPDLMYLYTPERPEVGVVEKLHSNKDVNGSFLQVSGRFLESMLDRNVICPEFVVSGKPRLLALEIVRAYGEDIPNLVILECAEEDNDEIVEANYLGENLSEVTYPLLQGVECSQRIVYDYNTGQMQYSVWQGKDRTQSQNVNSYVLFSDVSNNTENIEVDEDTSGYRNYVIFKTPSGFYEYDGRASTDEPKRCIFIDESNSDKTNSAFKRQAKEALLKWPKINNIEADTMQVDLLYLEDYDLGDKCDIVSNELRRSYESRIIEIREVFKDGKHEIQTVFGEKIPTIFERMMNK